MSSSFPSHHLSLWKINGVEEGRGGERWDDGMIGGEKWSVAVAVAAAAALVDESVLGVRCAIHA
jgi:hypothetical protein